MAIYTYKTYMQLTIYSVCIQVRNAKTTYSAKPDIIKSILLYTLNIKYYIYLYMIKYGGEEEDKKGLQLLKRLENCIFGSIIIVSVKCLELDENKTNFNRSHLI